MVGVRRVGLVVALVTATLLAIEPARAAGPLPSPPLRDLAAARGVLIGSAVDTAALGDEPDYAGALAEQFDTVVAENVMKFETIHPEADRYDFTAADALVDFAEAHDQTVRGHTLVWHMQLPDWLETADLTRDQAIEVLRDHITTVVGRYRGRIAQWDVVNEALPDTGSGLRPTPWLEWIGPDYLDLAFRFAHEADPEAQLFYNDYDPAATGEKATRILDLVADLKARGVPIDGVGMQLHVFTPIDGDAVSAQIERARQIGVAYAMTEVDIGLPVPPSPEQIYDQAQRFGTLLSACAAASATCTTFVLWGFTDRHSWIPGYLPGLGAATPLDEDLAPKPAWAALRHALDPTEPAPEVPPDTPVSSEDPPSTGGSSGGDVPAPPGAEAVAGSPTFTG